MLTGNRLVIPDLIKGFAVLFMIQVHIIELFARQEIYDGIIGKISLGLGGVPAAPAFMVLMGYFAALFPKEKKHFILRGIRLFAAGLALNFLININLAYHVFFKGWDTFINIYQYWLGADILHLAGLSLILIGLLKPLLKDKLLAWAAVTCLILLIPLLAEPFHFEMPWLNYAATFIYSSNEWSYFPLVPWMAYPLAGYTFRLIEMKNIRVIANRKFKVYASLGITVILILTFGWATHVTANLQLYYHHGFLFFLWATGFLLVWSSALGFMAIKSAENPAGRYIGWLGQNVTLIYFIQWIIIGNLATSIYKTQNILPLIVWFFAITLSSSIFVWLFRKKYSFRI